MAFMENEAIGTILSWLVLTEGNPHPSYNRLNHSHTFSLSLAPPITVLLSFFLLEKLIDSTLSSISFFYRHVCPAFSWLLIDKWGSSPWYMVSFLGRCRLSGLCLEIYLYIHYAPIINEKRAMILKEGMKRYIGEVYYKLKTKINHFKMNGGSMWMSEQHSSMTSLVSRVPPEQLALFLHDHNIKPCFFMVLLKVVSLHGLCKLCSWRVSTVSSFPP